VGIGQRRLPLGGGSENLGMSLLGVLQQNTYGSHKAPASPLSPQRLRRLRYLYPKAYRQAAPAATVMRTTHLFINDSCLACEGEACDEYRRGLSGHCAITIHALNENGCLLWRNAQDNVDW
jgi:hypothetical protein